MFDTTRRRILDGLNRRYIYGRLVSDRARAEAVQRLYHENSHTDFNPFLFIAVTSYYRPPRRDGCDDETGLQVQLLLCGEAR